MSGAGDGAVGSAAVIVASNRAASGVYADTSGPILVSGLAELGFDVAGPWVVADGEPVADQLRRAFGDGRDVALTSGGTGLTPTDRTPEATRPLLSVEVPGIAEALRAAGWAAGVPTSLLSRGLAGVVEDGGRRMLVVNLPGSSGAARDAMAVLTPLLGHAVAQMRGGDHR